MKPPQARYVWTDAHGEGRNRYALFRRTFTLEGAPSTGSVSIFADTRYRLSVNGVVVGHGPARFFAASPEYDTYDVTPFLRQGANVLAVAVNSYGCVTFHAERSIGGLIAWGTVTCSDGSAIALATDSSWKAQDSAAHQREVACLSFALNPGEVLDARKEPAGWRLPDFDDGHWPPAVVLEAQEHWGELRPRSIPLLDEREVLPRRLLGSWTGRDVEDEQIYSFTLPGRMGDWSLRGAPALAMTYLHSPRDQEVTFGAWWGRYWINGRELEPVEREDMARRRDFTARLHAGWNTFLAVERVPFGSWTLYLGLPRSCGLEVSAECEEGSANIFLLAGPFEGTEAELAGQVDLPLSGPEDLPDELGPWQPWPRGKSANSGLRERAWQAFARCGDGGPLEEAQRLFATKVEDGTLAVVYDFGGEVLGRPMLRFTAAEGTVVDVGYSEKLSDGLPDLYERYEVEMSERCIARGGEQLWQTFHPRGFRYLEVLVRGCVDAFEVQGVSATRANYPVRDAGAFACSDPLLEDIWRMGRDTLHACMEDAYLDCPWRERGLYAGDFLVEFHTNLATYGDTALMRRCIELFFLSQDDTGMLAPCPHGLQPGRLPDYSAVSVQALWDYYARSGDADFLRAMAPRLRRLMAALESIERPELGLLDADALSAHIELSSSERKGVTCALNCFHQRALHRASRILEVIGDGEGAAAYARKAAYLAQAVRGNFWHEGRGAFLDRLTADAPESGASVAANALALLYGIADESQAPRALEFLAQAMLDNFRVPDPKRHEDVNVSPYFSFYALGALYRYGRAREAEQFIRKGWGWMLEKGAWTCYEHFTPHASLCHAWSTAPTHYLSTQVLGVTLPEPARFDLVRVAPQPGSLNWAEGSYPHPHGPVRVSWRRKGGRLLLDCEAPEGVQIVRGE